ncbi:MAG: alpha/beta hydrolase [Rhodobacteraceae bacterium]|nr:alpha/beta hydrolase [Paracoccaceae bacterium]
METRHLELGNGRSLAYCRTKGQQPGVVFLGGLSSNMNGTKALHLENWAKRDGRAYLRFDYTGHGRSSGRFEDGCISDWTEDAMDAVSRLTDGPQVVVGSSMGGWIGLILATRIPERMLGFVGIAAAPDFTEDFREFRLSEVQLAALEKDGKVEVPSDRSDNPMIITKRLIDDGMTNLVLKNPLHLPFPARFLQGTADEDVNQEVAIRLLGHVTGTDVRLHLVKGADHRFSSPDCLLLIEQSVESVLAA